MFLPGCCFSLAISPARSRLISTEFFHSTLSSVRETTYFGVSLMWLAYGSSADVGQ
jgi:hypothetical protein